MYMLTTNEKLFGEAATDYVLAAELDSEKTTLEERLLELYEEQEKFEEICKLISNKEDIFYGTNKEVLL